VAYDLRMDFFQQLQRLSFGFHDKIHSGDLITRGMLDLEGTRAFIQGGMMQSLTLILLLSAATFMMVSTDPVMAALALAFVPIAGWALGRMGFLLR
ncbi:MAG TPA: ABC transporter transmembrane domain-containing protein, partial [Phenylobacterium sp.]|nr:ABC transporter transmembrane domain-containing protein [Phenylobacterium sp.]